MRKALLGVLILVVLVFVGGYAYLSSFIPNYDQTRVFLHGNEKAKYLTVMKFGGQFLTSHESQISGWSIRSCWTVCLRHPLLFHGLVSLPK